MGSLRGPHEAGSWEACLELADAGHGAGEQDQEHPRGQGLRGVAAASPAAARCAATRDEEQAVWVDTQGPVRPKV